MSDILKQCLLFWLAGYVSNRLRFSFIEVMFSPSVLDWNSSNAWG